MVGALLFIRIENPEGGGAPIVFSVEKNLSVSRSDLHPIRRRISTTVYLCTSVLRFFLQRRNLFSLHRFFSESAAAKNAVAWTRFVLAVAHIHLAESPFFQILHILSTSTYAALNFEADSRHRDESRDVTLPLSIFLLAFLSFHIFFPITLAHEFYRYLKRN